MRTALSACITIIAMCLLMVSSSFADGGGVKKVDNEDMNSYCEEKFEKYKSCSIGDEIEGHFYAKKGTKNFTGIITLTGVQYASTGTSKITKRYPISVDIISSLPLCDYGNVELMDRFQDYACKREVDKDFGYISVYPIVYSINVGNKKTCQTQNVLTGKIRIKMCPLTP